MALFIIGHGGFAREIAYILDGHFDGYLTDDEKEWGNQLPFKRVVGSIDSITKEYPFPGVTSCSVFFIPAVGSPKLKMDFVKRAQEKLFHPWFSSVHKQSFIGDAQIGDGSVICSMCSITTNVNIGRYVNVNLNCTIGHDVVIEDYVNLSPHCTISGKVHIKEGADLGSAVVVLPGVTIGKNTIVGAGAVVTKDLPDNITAVGIPAKIIRENS